MKFFIKLMLALFLVVYIAGIVEDVTDNTKEIHRLKEYVYEKNGQYDEDIEILKKRL